MGLQRDGQEPSGYIGVNPIVRPKTVIAKRSPLTTDRRYKIGTTWVDKSANTAYFLTSVVAGSATWALASPGATDVDTINGLSPSVGNIIVDGGTNLTDSNAGHTVTINMDNAITLSTSVTAPIYTSAAGLQVTPAAANILNLDAATGQDIYLVMGDDAATNKVSFRDSANLEVAKIDSNGGFTTTGLTFTGLFTALASATIETAGTTLYLASDNNFAA